MQDAGEDQVLCLMLLCVSVSSDLNVTLIFVKMLKNAGSQRVTDTVSVSVTQC